MRKENRNISGFHVPYEVRECELGLGLFAKAKVSAGSLIWEYKSGVNVREYVLEELPAHLEKLGFDAAQRLMVLSPFLGGFCCEILDDGHYMNHSDEPNCKTRSDLSVYALRDI